MKSMLSSLSSASESWVPRHANVAAHTLVKWSLSSNFFGSFDLGNCPPCFGSVIREEACS